MIDLARAIEGLARNVGTHAAAVVIADKPLTEYVPLCRVTGKDDVITQWSMNDVEAAGLLKMDFLGLRNLTVLSKSVELIEQTTGERVEPETFPLDDAKAFALLQRGETKGVFQLESGGIRDLLQRMKPDSFHDIIATNALYRPGPLEGGMVEDYVMVKHGRKEAQYSHPVLKDVLSETHGVMVYQEQVMRILNRLGGIPLANAYTCIKAISKKKESIIKATESGMAKKEAQHIWELIIKFAGYGFNKSHSTAYALIAYQTAYLKANYPVEFMAALLSSDIPGRNFSRKDSLVEHLEDCKRMEIEVVPPDINTSDVDFTVADGKILFGLSAIKGCSGAAPRAIVACRAESGEFRDLFEFCEKIELSSCNRASIEALIKAGAMDSLQAHRRQLYEALERAIQAGQAAAADRRSGQKSLFGAMDDDEGDAEVVPLPDVPEFEERETLMMEKEVLGFYLRSHPLAEYEKQLSAYASHSTDELSKLPDRTEVILGGMVSSIKFAHTKNARPDAPTKYVNFDLEDMQGSIRCILWPTGFAEMGDLVQADVILCIRGAVDRRGGGDEANLIVNELIPLDQLDARCASGILIRIEEEKHSPEMLPQLREIVRGYPGHRDLQFVLVLKDGKRVYLRSDRLRVGVTTELRSRITGLLGPGNYQLMTTGPPPANGNGNGGRRRQVR